MLKTALLARIQLKNLPLLGAQPGMNEKPERTLGKLLQPAHRGAQGRAKKLFRQRG